MTKITIKTHQESATLAIVSDIVRFRAPLGAGETVPENAPKGESQANGIVAKAIQAVGGMIRTIKFSLES